MAGGGETEIQYLAGRGKDEQLKGEFMCDKGQKASKWAKIGVLSDWQLQGFGLYEYGQPTPAGGWPRVHGTYKRTFTTPATWKTRTIFLKFEGVMTDTRVTVNGHSAGPIHQGGYYSFKYDVRSEERRVGK